VGDQQLYREAIILSTYKIIELVGTSPNSFEEAISQAVTDASASLRDLRVAEVTRLDVTIKDGKVEAYRARLNVSFKYER
jgi:flavin-binding protein dodecin